jgi:hypothetical protein
LNRLLLTVVKEWLNYKNIFYHSQSMDRWTDRINIWLDSVHQQMNQSPWRTKWLNSFSALSAFYHWKKNHRKIHYGPKVNFVPCLHLGDSLYFRKNTLIHSEFKSLKLFSLTNGSFVLKNWTRLSTVIVNFRYGHNGLEIHYGKTTK